MRDKDFNFSNLNINKIPPPFREEVGALGDFGESLGVRPKGTRETSRWVWERLKKVGEIAVSFSTALGREVLSTKLARRSNQELGPGNQETLG